MEQKQCKVSFIHFLWHFNKKTTKALLHLNEKTNNWEELRCQSEAREQLGSPPLLMCHYSSVGWVSTDLDQVSPVGPVQDECSRHQGQPGERQRWQTPQWRLFFPSISGLYETESAHSLTRPPARPVGETWELGTGRSQMNGRQSWPRPF